MEKQKYTPIKVVNLDDNLEVMILEVDEEKRRISLGMKQLSENPWQVFAHKHKEGDKITGLIKSTTDFGVFIGLEGDIDGLVHLSDVSWDQDEDEIRNLEKSQEVEAIILSIDAERERISLSIKHTQSDPFNDFVSLNKKGSKVKGIVTSFDEDKIYLRLSEGVEGFLPYKDFINSSSSPELEEGLELDVIVANIQNKERGIILSIRALEKAEEKEAIKENIQKNKKIEEETKSSLGDMIKAEIEENDDE